MSTIFFFLKDKTQSEVCLPLVLHLHMDWTMKESSKEIK